ETYMDEFNKKFAVAAAETGTAFVPTTRQDLDRVFSIQHERMVRQDNTVCWANGTLQIEPQSWRSTLAGCRVTIYQHLDGTLSLGYGPHEVGRFSQDPTLIGDFQPASTVGRKKKSAQRRWGLISSKTVTSAA